MPFGVVSGIGQGIGVLEEPGPHPQMGRWFGFFHPIGLTGVFECIFKTEIYLTYA